MRFVSHVGPQEFGLDAEGAQFSGQLAAGFLTAAGHDNVGAFMGEGQGRGAADAGQGASDQDGGGVHRKLLQRGWWFGEVNCDC